MTAQGRLCVVFRFLTVFVPARTTDFDPDTSDHVSRRELFSSDWFTSQGFAACWRSDLLLNNRDFGSHPLRWAGLLAHQLLHCEKRLWPLARNLFMALPRAPR